MLEFKTAWDMDPIFLFKIMIGCMGGLAFMLGIVIGILNKISKNIKDQTEYLMSDTEDEADWWKKGNSTEQDMEDEEE